ncbi:MAG: autotransporter-associated beta strand repeat-containing protein, partial [Verrucomicrobiae bacterium]
MKTISLKLFPIRHSLFGGTFLAALIAMAFATLPAAAQTIFWGAPTTISGDTDVSTLGTGLYAYTGGSGAATVNGVAFAAGNSGTAWGANVTLANLGSTYSGFNGAAAPFTSLSAAYQTVLKGGAYGSSGNPTVTLNGLTANERYLVQIWLNDSRATGRFATTSGNGVSLLYCVGNTVGGVGQYALGYFIATGTSATFALTPSQAGGQQLNAIQVRDLGTATLSSGTWTQTGTGVQNWGTGGNWSGSTIAEGNAANANFNSVDVPTTDINPQLDQPRVINSLTFGDTATGTAGNWLLSGVSTIYGFLVLDGTTPTITVNTLGTSKTATISAAIFGNQGLTKAGNGTLSLTGSAVYTGATTVNGGTLSAGSLPPSSALTVASGATLKCTGYGIMGGTTANIAAWTIAGTINNVQNYNSQTMPASVTLNNGTMNGSVLTTYGSFYAQSAVTITANGNANSISTANIAGSSVTFNTPLVTDVLAISGYLGGTGANGLTVTKSGLGTLTLSGVNTYTGGTTINASGGTLQIG